MTRIIPTVIIHLTGKEQLIKKREEKKRGLEVRGGGGCGGGVKAGGCVCVGGGGDWRLSSSLESGPSQLEFLPPVV